MIKPDKFVKVKELTSAEIGFKPDGYYDNLKEQILALHNEQKREEQLARLEKAYQDYQGEDKVISSYEIAENLKTRTPIVYIPTGIHSLDEILGGFVKKQLIVIAAPTKNGKTSFCIELTTRLKDYNPLWIPFEEPAEELIQKFLDRKEQPPLFYTPDHITGNTLAWIEKRIIESKVKYDSQVVFIDHLHFIVPMNDDRMDLRIGQAMRELKRLAKQWNVVIFIISHLSKTKMDTQPDLEDLRDSSFTAQEADTVIMLWRKTVREQGQIVIMNEVNISVQANRRTGKTGNVKMMFENGKFIELSKYEDAQLDTKNW